MALPLDRFEPAVLEELKSEAASNIEFEDDKIVIKHVYIERRMQPLNLFLAEAGADVAVAARSTRPRVTPQSRWT